MNIIKASDLKHHRWVDFMMEKCRAQLPITYIFMLNLVNTLWTDCFSVAKTYWRASPGSTSSRLYWICPVLTLEQAFQSLGDVNIKLPN